jgi:flagella basal body P-ring formation protein FlgA
MNMLENLMIWLNTGPTPSICLRRDGVYPMLSWHDLTQAQKPVAPISVRSLAWLVIIAFGLPTLLFAEQPRAAADVPMTTVPVLTSSVAKGTTLTAEMLTQQSVPASQVFASTITALPALLGQQTTRALTAGQPINRLHVRAVPLVARESAVTVLYQRGSVVLTGRGDALEDGQLGQSIRVRNPASRSTLVATVSGPGTVTVQ